MSRCEAKLPLAPQEVVGPPRPDQNVLAGDTYVEDELDATERSDFRVLSFGGGLPRRRDDRHTEAKALFQQSCPPGPEFRFVK